MMSGNKNDDRMSALAGLERQSCRLRIEKIKVYNKLQQLVGLCLFSGNGMDGFDTGLLRQSIVRLCEELGARCSWSAAPPVAHDGAPQNGKSPERATNRRMAEDHSPSCQVSVEEKIQLFSFLKKG